MDAKTRDALMDVAQEHVVNGDDNAAVDALVVRGATLADAHEIVADVKNHPVTRAMVRAREPLLNASYHCSACKHTHNTASGIGRDHKRFAVSVSR